MSKQLIWVYKDKRTNPGTVHRFTSSGEPNAVVVHILREQSGGDATHAGPDAVENVVITAPPNSRCLSHLPPGWREQVWWGPNDEFMGPRGILFVWDEEYKDPHAELALAETSRAGHESVPEVVLNNEAKMEADKNNAPGVEPPAPVEKKPEPKPTPEPVKDAKTPEEPAKHKKDKHGDKK